MTVPTAFVGDIHGNFDALLGIWSELRSREIAHTVFLGDYINKGQESSRVLEFLLGLVESDAATMLAGNHENALVTAFETKDLRAFLKMGGAATIRSYVRGPVSADVLSDFAANFPHEQLMAIRSLPTSFETSEILAQHTRPSRHPTGKYSISAHSPIGKTPRINSQEARLDTGCGEDGGRLTALIWPTLDYIQVNNDGTPVRNPL